MTSQEFEAVLRKLDPGISIVPNHNRPGLSNIKLNGADICPVPTDDIREEMDPSYFYTFPNGMSAPHNSIKSATEKVEHVLNLIKDPDKRDAFFGQGNYA